MTKFKFIPYYAYKLTIGAFSSRTTSTIAYIAVGTVLIVAASLTIMCAVMQGFHTATLTQLQTVWADIMVDAYGEELATEAIAEVLNKRSGISAYAFQARTQAPIIIDTDINRVATIIAIDPDRELSVSKLCSAIKTPCSTVQKALEHRQILVGSMMADDLALIPGENISIGTVNTQGTRESSIALQKVPLTVAGTVHTGLEDLDASIIVMSLETFEDIFDEGPTAVAIAATDSGTIDRVVAELKQVLPSLSVYSFSQRNPAILAALAIEQLVTWLLIILMTIIALSSLVAMMLMVLNHNQKQLLICLLHGCSTIQLRIITIAACGYITIPATIIGILLGSITAIIIRDVLPIQLPPLYYVSTVPIELSAQVAILMIIGAVISAMIVGTYAARTIIPKNIIQELS